MAFSVLLSLYFKEKATNLRESLNSIFCQTLPADEVVLVLDGPIGEELMAVVNEYSQKYSTLKVVPLPKNLGLGEALNHGIKYCTHDIIARMDTDDISVKHRFEEQISYMINHPEISVMSSWIDEFIGEFTNIVSLKQLPVLHNDIYLYGKKRCPINHPAAVYRKSDVIECGGYGIFPEDYYLWAKMLKAGKKFYNMPKCLLHFRTTNDVYKRRGGYKYALAIYKLQKFMWSIGYINFLQFWSNSLIRITMSLLPNSIRSSFYKKALRSSNSTNSDFSN